MKIRAAGVLMGVATVVVAACAGDDSGGGSTASSLATSHSVSTVVTTTAVAAEPETWTVVAIGDSLVAGAGVGGAEYGFSGVYARLLGEQLGVDTDFYPYLDYGTVAEVARNLEVTASLRDEIASAEVVIVWLGYHNVLGALWGETCDTQWPEPLRSCLVAATETMPADFDRLLGIIESLVSDGTLVMIGNQALGPPEIEQWGGEPFWPELRAVAYDGWAQGITDAAAAHGAVVVDSVVWFTGPDGNQLLREEYLQPDRIHLTSEGQRALAQLFLDADGL